ncbi:8822_t:CDS:1 [Cetraspora pellucida]|uniref:8822_t:CDS:1 n=1 Tax=Cetraspora pellucida TaxID=1433469 RepID=A0A9N8VDK1_9GLOM|nr:8822_t:CDS:1 [Cetraspora pellucida]
MVTVYDETQNARFRYDSENQSMVLGDTFENKVAWYLKKKKLKPKVIKNYLINNGRLLFNNEKSLRLGSVIMLDNGCIKDLEVYNSGKYTLFGDDGTDIICNWNGYPLLIQCKYRSKCDICVEKDKICYHSYWKSGMIEDIKKLDKKLSEYKIPIFGIFVVSEGIGIYSNVSKIQYDNCMMVVNFSDDLYTQIEVLGRDFLSKTQKMDWCIELENNKRIELELVYRYFEGIIDEKIEKTTEVFFRNMKKVLYYIRKAYGISDLNDICNTLDNLKIV